MAKQAQLVLGTAQIGLPYGIANKIGLPNERDAVALIRRAVDAGITSIDTARTYGLAEARIGRALLGFMASQLRRNLIHATLSQPARRRRLRSPRPTPASRPRARPCNATVSMCCCCIALSTALDEVARSGATWPICRRRGASAYLAFPCNRPQSFDGLTDPLVHHVQLPFNLLDHRWSESGVIAALRARPEVIVHVRSILLPGPAQWPRRSALAATSRCSAGHHRRHARAERCHAQAREHSWISVSHMRARRIGSMALLSVWKRQSKWQRTSPYSHDGRCRPHS
jgi:aryl-alcohol dehydrogenase-like predicted oxidoreductase